MGMGKRLPTSDWRRRRDSNPRYGFRPYNGLANRRLQPLGHVSGDETSVSATSGPVKDWVAASTQTAIPRRPADLGKLAFAIQPASQRAR
jgi:hypothetical protein